MLWLLRLIGAMLGRTAFYAGVRTAVTLDNLRHGYPNLTERARRRIAARSYSALGQIFFEFAHLRYASAREIKDGLTINNLDDVRHLIGDPNGAILLSAHLGNWEWLALGVGLQVKSLNVITKAQRSSVTERFLLAMRTRFGNRMIDAGDVRRIYRVLRSGELVAILGDQGADPDSVRVKFFGRTVPTFEGAARLALRTRAPILFLQVLKRTDQGYLCTFHHVPYDDLRDASDDNVRILTERHTAMLEQIIREKPELWLWQHRRWKNATEQSN